MYVYNEPELLGWADKKDRKKRKKGKVERLGDCDTPFLKIWEKVGKEKKTNSGTGPAKASRWREGKSTGLVGYLP